jgi:DNA-directed RNA polymerase II subunit RPB7
LQSKHATPALLPHMYFKAVLYQNVFVPARLFGGEIQDQILSNVITMTEGKKISPFGTVIVITSFFPFTSLGKILPGSSSALFRISYNAITFRAMKGEIIDIFVTHTTKFGFFGEAGLLEVFISKKLIPSDYVYDANKNGFYNQSLETSILKGDKVMVRILGVRQTQGTGLKNETEIIQAIGTMKV